VLLKPNILNGADPARGVTTHPAFIAAVIRLLKAAGAQRILGGDSPGWMPQNAAGKITGIREAAEAEGAVWADFSTGREVPCPEGKLVKSFVIAEPFFEADFLFDLPKLKTHMLTKYTGAIKNLFGLVPGLAKSAWHMRFPARDQFSTMLVDLATLTRPDFTFMDAILAMEGLGPNNGQPKVLDLVLASRDPVALDRVAARIIGYDPGSIAHLAEASARGIWVAHDSDIGIHGCTIDEVKPDSFQLVHAPREGTPFSKILPKPVHRLIRDITVLRPAFDHDRCRLCGACVDICPAKALRIEGKGKERHIRIDYEPCIRCYCCHEVCPHDAIGLVRWPRGRSGTTHVPEQGGR
jgi:uncharacterized protein (DUF362 family)/ferredoxin